MHGKHFIYVLVREDRLCLKVGTTSGIKARMRSLHRKNGRFCSKLSFAYRADSRDQADEIEGAVKKAFWGKRIEIPKGKHRNGETEWFVLDSYDAILKYVQDNFEIRNGAAVEPQPIDFHAIAPLSDKDKRALRRFKNELSKIVPQIEAKSANTDYGLLFKKTITFYRKKLEGVARIRMDGSLHDRYELYFPPKSFSRSELQNWLNSAFLEADNEELWSRTNFHKTAECNPVFQRICMKLPNVEDDFEGTWESRGYLKQYRSLLDELVEEKPLSARLKPYAGNSD